MARKEGLGLYEVGGTNTFVPSPPEKSKGRGSLEGMFGVL